jgi:hypothetical protein
MTDDVIARFDECFPGEALLQPVMLRGRIVAPVDLEESRKRCEQQVQQLPEQYRRLERAASAYPVQFSANLCADFARLRERMISPAAAARGRQWNAAC